MTHAHSPVQIAPARHSNRSGWSTPALLRAGLYMIFASVLLVMAAAIWGVLNDRRAIHAIVKEAAPGVAAAHQMLISLAGMDANAGSEFLSKEREPDAFRAFEDQRQAVAAAILGAAEHDLGAGHIPIQKLLLGLGFYAAQIQQLRDMRRTGDKRFPDTYGSAVNLIDRELLPAAAALERATSQDFDRDYATQQADSSKALIFLVLSSIPLGGVLVFLQVLLAVRMRRVLNPMLVCATAIALLFTLYMASTLRTEDDELKAARASAWEPIHALRQARASAYIAKADETRYLLSPTQFPVGETECQERAAQIARHLSGASTREALSAFSAYREIGKRIRNLEQSGRHQAAIALFTGEATAQFNRFDQALVRRTEMDQKAFDSAIDQDFRRLDGFDVGTPLAGIAIGALALLGLAPRVREYSV